MKASDLDFGFIQKKNNHHNNNNNTEFQIQIFNKFEDFKKKNFYILYPPLLIRSFETDERNETEEWGKSKRPNEASSVMARRDKL